jgi:hypothetical protein
MIKFKCIFCGWECTETKKVHESICDHLMQCHEMDFRSYYELIKQYKDDPQICWKCGNSRQQMTTWSNEYLLPCWDCVGDVKTDAQDAAKVVLDYYRDIHAKATKDRYFQYYLSISDEERNKFLSHDYNEIEKLLSDITKRDKVKLGKDSFFKFETNPWSLNEFSERNKDNIKCKPLSGFPDKDYMKKKVKVWELTLSDGRVVEIRPPEAVEYDVRHHSRYSMLNLSARRQTRKLRIGDAPPWNRCIKFHNTDFTNVKAIIGVNWKGEEKITKNISIRELPEKDVFMIKQFIIKNKELWKSVLEILMELLKYVENIEDHVFAHKTIYLGPYRTSSLVFHWFPLDYYQKGKLNVTIM